MDIPNNVKNQLNPSTKHALNNLSEEQLMYFIDEFQRKKKDPGLMLVLAIFFPIQLFLIGKTGLAIAFWLTGGGCGIWWIIEMFMAMPRTREYNDDIAKQIFHEVKTMHNDTQNKTEHN
jgi:hypothetical protein